MLGLCQLRVTWSVHFPSRLGAFLCTEGRGDGAPSRVRRAVGWGTLQGAPQSQEEKWDRRDPQLCALCCTSPEKHHPGAKSPINAPPAPTAAANTFQGCQLGAESAPPGGSQQPLCPPMGPRHNLRVCSPQEPPSPHRTLRIRCPTHEFLPVSVSVPLCSSLAQLQPCWC